MNDAYTPADPAEVCNRIAFALRHRRTGKAARDHEQAMAADAAAHVLEMLRLAGYVVMQAAPAPAHSGPSGWKPASDPDQ